MKKISIILFTFWTHHNPVKVITSHHFFLLLMLMLFIVLLKLLKILLINLSNLMHGKLAYKKRLYFCFTTYKIYVTEHEALRDGLHYQYTR